MAPSSLFSGEETHLAVGISVEARPPQYMGIGLEACPPQHSEGQERWQCPDSVFTSGEKGHVSVSCGRCNSLP